MTPCDCISSIIADWFAGVGTVGAVIFALYQNHNANRPKFKVKVSAARYWSRTSVRHQGRPHITMDQPAEDPNYTNISHDCILISVHNISHIRVRVIEKGFHFNGVSYISQSPYQNITVIHPYQVDKFSVDYDEIEEKLNVFHHHHTIRIKFYIVIEDGRIIFSDKISYNFRQ